MTDVAARAGWLTSREFTQSVLDAVPQHIAVLDQNGEIVATNAAWRRFGLDNGLDERAASCLGVNYLAVCDRATGRYAAGADTVAAGIRAVAEGRRSEFEMEYPCSSGTEERWFVVRPARFVSGGRTWVVVTHENITERKQAERQLRLLTAELSHRVKNALATVQGIMMQMLQRTDSLENFEQDFSRRLDALARGYDLLVRSKWGPAELSALLHDTLAPYGGEERGIDRLRRDTPAGPDDTRVQSDRA